jgi:hypothetical protein
LKVSERAGPRRDRSILEDRMIMVAYYKIWYLMDWLNRSYFIFIIPHSMVWLFIYKICFYTLILFPSYQRDNTKHLPHAMWTRAAVLKQCVALHSSVLKLWPLVYTKNRVNLLGKCCRTLSCSENKCKLLHCSVYWEKT